MDGCTIIARNYLPHARVLANSYRSQHPAAAFTTLIIDDDGQESRLNEPFRALSPYDIGLDRQELHRMAVIYDVKEFATAVKPSLLRTLLAAHGGCVAYLDPDIQVFSPLDDVADVARRKSIVLTPHTTEPLPRDGLLPSEEMILRAGIYNLGFIAVSEQARPFLDWWAERLERDCLVAVEEGIFVDQRWVDFVPALFDHAIVNDPGLNVAYWNLSHRRLDWVVDHWEVNGEPLRFFHFSGYNPDRPDALSAHAGPEPRIALPRQSSVRRICDEYGRLLRRHGFGSVRATPYRFDRLPNGAEIDGPTRRLIRAAIVAAERRGELPPPDPFDASTTEGFLEWLRAPVPPAALPRHLMAVYHARPDLRAAFPDLEGLDRDRFREWVIEATARGERVVPSVIDRNDATHAVSSPVGARVESRLRSLSASHPRLARATPLYKRARRLVRSRPTALVQRSQGRPRPTRPGVNVAGYLRAELGVGEAARRLVRALEVAGIPHSTHAYGRTVSRQLHPFQEGTSGRKDTYDINVVCVNADELPNFRDDVGPAFFEGRYTIGLWFWEVSRFPPEFARSCELVDEVWVASDFVREAVGAATTKPVVTIPLPIEQVTSPVVPRSALGLPDGYVFLFAFDYLSVFERKNPLGLIEAFSRAFQPDEGPVLVIKTINGDLDPTSRARLEEKADARPDVLVLDGYVTAEERDSLVAACDCYVSLHRSEGYGLTMAEALALGKPVIATGYSGNLAFMDGATSHLVPYELSTIPEGCGPYPPGGEWAEPDLTAAADLMRQVWRDPAAARELGGRAMAAVTSRSSAAAAGAAVAARLESIRREVGSRGAPAPMPGHSLVSGPTITPTAIARRLLRRLLWPELLDRRAHEEAVAVSIDHLARRPTELDDRLRAASRSHDASTEALRAEITAVRTQTEALRTQAEALPAAVQRASQALREELDLSPRPYVADAKLLYTVGEDGEATLGYADANGSAAPYRAFEDIFRGPEDFIRERQRFYVSLLTDRAPVLDAGCGRGELLELLRDAGVEAEGVDADPDMIARSREKGLSVTLGDLTDHLREAPPDSLGAIFAAQVIEHLSYEDLLSFFSLSLRALRPDGVLIAETVNPHSFPAFKMFWTDPSHRAPIYPEVAVALCRIYGFASARIVFPNGAGDLERDRRVEGEYAVVARKAATAT